MIIRRRFSLRVCAPTAVLESGAAAQGVDGPGGTLLIMPGLFTVAALLVLFSYYH